MVRSGSHPLASTPLRCRQEVMIMARMTYTQKLGVVAALVAAVLLGTAIIVGGGRPMALALAVFGALTGLGLQQLSRRHEQRLHRP